MTARLAVLEIEPECRRIVRGGQFGAGIGIAGTIPGRVEYCPGYRRLPGQHQHLACRQRGLRHDDRTFAP